MVPIYVNRIYNNNNIYKHNDKNVLVIDSIILDIIVNSNMSRNI